MAHLHAFIVLTEPVFGNKNRRKGERKPYLSRKDQRKASRVEKKRQNGQNRKTPPIPAHHSRRPALRNDTEDEDEDDLEDSEDDATPPRQGSKQPQQELRGILKTAPSLNERESALSVKVPRAVKDKIAQDNADIAALEKKLGIKGKKKSKGVDDGLEDLFGDIREFSSEEGHENYGSKRKRVEDSDWLAGKRRKALGVASGDSSESEEDDGMGQIDSDDLDSENEEDLEQGFDTDDGLNQGESSDLEGLLSQEEGEDEDDEENESEEGLQATQTRTRENPYIAPVVSDAAQVTKYLPPALRASSSSDTAALLRLKRQLQGLFNRLSEANMLTILRDIENIYQNNPRGHVNTTLVDLLIGMLSDPSTLLDTFLILHAGFIATIYKVIGPDFGAQMVERVVSEIDKFYQKNKEGAGKQTTNLISVIAELYTFQVIGSNIVFDYIRFFLDELTEINTELLLRIVRAAGSQLRQDDPTALKDIVALLQKSVAKVGQANLPVRTKFMIETINDLKNNRMKTGIGASTLSKEHTTQMKKQLGTLNSRNLKATEPLRVGLNDIRDTEKKGKWWLVGASWRNEANAGTSVGDDKDTNHRKIEADEEDSDGEVDLVQLAREHRMNTDIRRAIFISIMSASDFKDAQMRLTKLNLKKSQETEIPRVIVHCAGAESTYNPYYTILARKICSDHKTRKSFQFALWDIFKSLGEKQDEADDLDDGSEADDGDKVSLRKLVNQGKLYGTLIGKKALPLTCLKNINFPYLQPNTKTLIDVLLVTAILESLKGHQAKGKRNERTVREVFIEVDQAPEMIAGLQWFLKKVTSRTDIVEKHDKETVRWACKSITDMLAQILATTTMHED